jgi:cysteinyl-tRNA synthetase
MSKSLGNFFTVRDLLDQGIPGEVIRFVLLGTHYGKPMDWTAARVEEAYTTLNYLYRKVGEVRGDQGTVESRAYEALCNDLNTPEAIRWLINEAGYVSEDGEGVIAENVKATANLLGLLRTTASEWFQGRVRSFNFLVDELLDKRLDARRQKNWQLSDAIRDGLHRAGIKVSDNPSGATWEVLRLDSMASVAARVNRALAEESSDEADHWQQVFERMKRNEQASLENREQMIRDLHRTLVG